MTAFRISSACFSSTQIKEELEPPIPSKREGRQQYEQVEFLNLAQIILIVTQFIWLLVAWISVGIPGAIRSRRHF